MPDATLLAELEGLREIYSQRQKAAAGVLTALKGATSALGKAQRAAREYAAQGEPTEALAQAQQALAAQRIKEEAVDPLAPELRRQEKALTTVSTALREALAALRAEATDVVKLGRAYQALQASKIPDQALRAVLPGLAQELEAGQRALGDTFGLALRHALAEQGIALGGRPPEFEIGPFALVADFVGRSAALSYGKNRLSKRIPLSVEAVIKAYQRESKLISGRNEDGARWIEQLYTAWENVRRKRLASELRVPIVECYLELVVLRQPKAWRSEPTKGGFIEYSRAQFAYDLYQFTSRTPVPHKGLHGYGLGATMSQTDNPERSIWVVDGDSPHAGRYVSDLKFDRDA